MGDEEVEYKAEYLDTEEDAELEVHGYMYATLDAVGHIHVSSITLSLIIRGYGLTTIVAYEVARVSL